MDKKYFFIISLLMIIGGVLRIINLENNPVSLNVDEVSIGYNAYSILQTGRDEYGQFLPLSFRSLNDYKLPGYFYMVVPFISVLGLNEFAIRLPAALMGVLSIPIYYFLISQLIKDKRIALVGATMIAVSSWHIYHSRIALETVPSVAFAVLGIYFFLKTLNGPNIFLPVFSAIFTSFAMYSYQTERVFLPLMIIALILIYRNKILSEKKEQLTSFFLTGLLLFLPLFFAIILGYGSSSGRVIANFTLQLYKDATFIREVLTLPIQYQEGVNALLSSAASERLLLFITWLRKALSYFDVPFLFFKGLGMLKEGTLSLGILYIFEIPFLIAGIYYLSKIDLKTKLIVISWILIGVLPATLTLGPLNPRRILIISPVVMLISAAGAVFLYDYVKKYLKRSTQLIMFGSLGGLLIFNLAYSLLIFSVHFNNQKGEGLMEGNKEAILFVKANQSQFDEVVFDPDRGIEGPYIKGVPHIYYLFYTKFDPQTYQNLPKKSLADYYSFNNFTIRHINWTQDRLTKNKLFIGSPWSLPLKDISENQIVKKIYLTNGQLAYVIVSTK